MAADEPYRHNLGSSEDPRPYPQDYACWCLPRKGIVRVEEVPVPEVADGEVLIKVAACGICGTDIKKIYHAYVPRPRFWHEIAGMS